MSLKDLPALNACLNGFCAILLSFGYYFIRRGKIIQHRRCMIAAVITSTIFLASYLTYHFTHGMTRFKKPPEFRAIYLTLLFTHTVCAVIILPMIIVTLTRALKTRFDLHKKIARWTWPIWMYVSVTGVIVYLLLYKIFPQG